MNYINQEDQYLGVGNGKHIKLPITNLSPLRPFFSWSTFLLVDSSSGLRPQLCDFIGIKSNTFISNIKDTSAVDLLDDRTGSLMIIN